MDDDRSGGQDRVRLPGHDKPSGSRRPAYTWAGADYGPPGGYGPPRGYWPAYGRDGGIRRSRRASSWTAAALVAGVAATTGYLAHSIPATGAGSAAGKSSAQQAHKIHQAHHARSRTVVRAPSAPVVRAPVVTSGGSGTAGGAGGGGNN